MRQTAQNTQQSSGASRAAYVPKAVTLIVAATVFLIPLRIVSQGFLPDDDALADAAKAVSGRPWTDVLILKDYFRLDPHVGWHALLRLLPLAADPAPHAIVLTAVVGLFAVFSW